MLCSRIRYDRTQNFYKGQLAFVTFFFLNLRHISIFDLMSYFNLLCGSKVYLYYLVAENYSKNWKYMVRKPGKKLSA